MSLSEVDIDMASPPASPCPEAMAVRGKKPEHVTARQPLAAQPKTQPPPRSSPVPIVRKQPAARSPGRFQPPIAKPGATTSFVPDGPHAPTAAYSHTMFKPKAPRSASSAAAPSKQQRLTNGGRLSPFVKSLATPDYHRQQLNHQQLQHQGQHQNLLPAHSPPQASPPIRPQSLPSCATGRPVQRTAPLQIPQSSQLSASTSALDSRPPPRPSACTPTTTAALLATSAVSVAIPVSLPSISPSFPATLFGGLSADDEHVTVWEPHTGKTVAGNAAPYRRNLSNWLEGHPGWEEKADELKSSKRRSAARRSRSAADAFASLCCYPVATQLAHDAAKHLRALGDGDHCDEEAMMTWTNDDFVRLQEALFRLGQECHASVSSAPQSSFSGPVALDLDETRWGQVCTQIGGSKMQGTVLYCAHHMLTRGITKSQREMGSNAGLAASFSGVSMSPGGAESSAVGSPNSASSYDNTASGVLGGPDLYGPSSLPTLQSGVGASFLERSFRAPREPRVTVWNPDNGRTISGNAAPCRRNLGAWMRQHPGWVPKEEGQLSSSRRNRNRKIRPSSLPSTNDDGPLSEEPESPHFKAALQGLLFLSQSPSGASAGTHAGGAQTGAVQLEAQVARVERARVQQASGEAAAAAAAAGDGGGKQMGMTSSVSSSSGEEGAEGMMSDGEAMEEMEEMEAGKMEL